MIDDLPSRKIETLPKVLRTHLIFGFSPSIKSEEMGIDVDQFVHPGDPIVDQLSGSYTI